MCDRFLLSEILWSSVVRTRFLAGTLGIEVLPFTQTDSGELPRGDIGVLVLMSSNDTQQGANQWDYSTALVK